MKRAKLLGLPAAAVLIGPLLAGCGEGSGGDGGGSGPIVMGSTDNRITSLDPAGVWETSTWTLLTNTFQTLLRYSREGSEPQPDAAEKCLFTDQKSTAYRCTVRSGLKFSNGNTLNAEDVAHSIRRSMKIKDDSGPWSLFSNIDRVETPDDSTVVFHLKKPDATLPFVLATPAAAIVDADAYPGDKLIGKDQIVGSGPYKLDSFERAKDDHDRVLKARFSRNSDYKGGISPKNGSFEVRYFARPDQMVAALESGDIDLTHRSLTPKQILALEDKADKGSLKLVEAPGTEIRYLVFNTKHPSVKNLAVRQAMAQILDRKALTRDVYQRTTEPLLSMIPKGIPAHTNAFYNEYGDPSIAKARALLQKANVTTPVNLTLWYTSDHYGSVTKDEFEELKNQFEASGLFKVSIKGKLWPQYKEGYQNGDYGVFGMGWYPDFPDPDNFISPFMGPDNFMKLPYSSDTILNQVLPRSRQQSERGAVVDEFDRAQQILAKDVPLLPVWQGKQYIATRDNISGVEWTLDASSTFRFWELQKGSGE